MHPALLVAFLAPAVSASSWPDDIVLSNLGTWDGNPVEQAVAKDAYNTVVREMGVAISNKPMAPGETLGIYGFDVGVGSSVAFIHSRDESSTTPSAWSRVDENQDAPDVIWVPWIQARKGLPLSIEIGGSVGYIAFSRETTFGGFARWGLIEGYFPIPDLAIQVGYSGYVGNQELELGTLDTTATLGYTLPFGTINGINQAQFSPYIGGGILRIHATPRLSDADQAEIGIGPVSGFSSSELYDPSFRRFALDGGFRIVNGSFQLRISATYVPGVEAMMNAGMGFTY